MGAQNFASSILYQRTNHNGNNEVNDYDYSQSFETPREFFLILTVLVIKSPQRLHNIDPHFLHLEKSIYIFQTVVRTVWSAQCAKSRVLIKIMISIFEIDLFEK